MTAALRLTQHEEYVWGCFKCGEYHAFGEVIPGQLCPRCRAPLKQLWHPSISELARMTQSEINEKNKRDAQNKAKRQVTVAVKVLQGIRTVAQYRSSTGSSIHTVETDGEGGYKCTCQGFRIRKRGSCKHTEQYANTKDPGIYKDGQ